MTRMPRTLATFVVGSLVLAACGGAGTPAPSGAGGATALSGDIRIDGSSTVFPVSEAMAEEFQALYPDVRVTVGISGTGGGFKKFCNGETDISDASRAIKQDEGNSEAAVCAENGVEWVEMQVAIDGLSVIAHPDNDWVDCLTAEELKSIWDAGSAVNNWSQVRAGFPDAPIELYGPGSDSGTFDYFTDAVNGEEKRSRSDYTASEDDNVLVQGVTGSVNSLGYFGYAYYIENADRLKLIDVDMGDGCVTPTPETVESYEYGLARPIYIYPSVEALKRPEVKAFVEFYMDPANRELISEVGYIPAADNIYADALARALEAAE